MPLALLMHTDDRPSDGINLLPILRGESPAPARNLFWCSGSEEGRWAVRAADWKLVAQRAQVELFGLAKDTSEMTNLANARPDKLDELTRLHDDWLAQMARPVKAGEKKWTPAHKPRAAKPQPAGPKPGADPAAGLVPKFCKLTVADGADRVEADGRTPFLGAAQIKASGPITLKLRARSAKGGPGKVQWVTQDQTEFPATGHREPHALASGVAPPAASAVGSHPTGQTVAFALPAGGEWQDITVDIPLTGDRRLLRLYLPADKSPVEIASIQYTGKTGPLKTWNFTSEKP